MLVVKITSTLGFFFSIYTDANANKLCQDHALYVMGDQYIHTSAKKISLPETFVNPVEIYIQFGLHKHLHATLLKINK